MSPTRTLSPHTWSAQVRDYEVDGFGGVSAATYLNYFEEARKHYLLSIGLDLMVLWRRHIGFVVGRYEVDYLLSLVGGDEWVIETSMARVSRLKVEFTQHLYRLPERSLAVRCKNIGLPVNTQTNRPFWPQELNEILVDFPVPR
jgi:acyl-CoA thioester hydrolase